jgi:hypothetical protein
MADNTSGDVTPWLAVIGKSLAYLCLSKAIEHQPDRFAEVLAKVEFLHGLGLSDKDSANAAGTTVESIRVLRSQRKKAKNGKAKKKARVAR